MLRYLAIFFIIIVPVGKSQAAAILLYHENAEVWHYEQHIAGEISDFTTSHIRVHHNTNSFVIAVDPQGKFSFEITLREKENKIWIEAASGDSVIHSDTLHYTLGYVPTPTIKPYATVHGDSAQLHAATLENPYQTPLQYVWYEDPRNPAPCPLTHPEDSITHVEVPETPGIYYFNLLVVADHDSSWYQTYIKRDQTLLPYRLETDDTQWMHEAVIYQITPYNFVKNGRFDDITAKLEELKGLGINTIWLQPVSTPSHRGQGYDVVDYFAVNPALGTEADLHQLIATAKALGMKVLFDVVLNHTSIHHPYARDRIRYGKRSHYFYYYQHEDDGKPYASFYNKDAHGFINYFWEDLVNLNYQHPEVQRWMLEVCKHWIRKFDIDGYRFDAIWGVNARMPSFAKQLRSALKSIKPDVLLLAEDKGAVPEVFELGYEIAYDWTADTSWVSQWSWAYEYHERKSFTVFNHPVVEKRAALLRHAIFEHHGNPHRQLRFMENNDLPRFIADHGLQRTKMAAALLFSLPGIPMLYNGQEIGFKKHPYGTGAIFHADQTIQSLDQQDLFPYYQQLIRKYKELPVLRDTTLQEIQVSPEKTVVAFQRWKDDERLIVIINLDREAVVCSLNLKDLPWVGASRKYVLKDILHEESFGMKRKLSAIPIPMNGYSVRWLVIQKK